MKDLTIKAMIHIIEYMTIYQDLMENNTLN